MTTLPNRKTRSRKIRSIRAFLSAFLALALLAPLGVLAQQASRPVEAKPPTYSIRFGSIAPMNSPWGAFLNSLQEHYDKASKGRIKFDIMAGGVLGSESAMMRLIKRGELDAYGGSLSNLATELSSPELGAIELPFLFESEEEVDHIVDKVVFDDMAKVFDRNNLVLLMFVDHGWYSFASRTKPLRTPQNFKGTRMRSNTSGIHIETIRTLGGYPVPLSVNDVLNALQSGSIEAIDTSPVLMYVTHWYPTIRFLNLTKHSYQISAIAVSKPFFESLPKDIQEILLQNRLEHAKLSRKLVREKTGFYINSFKEVRIRIIEPTEEERAALKKQTAPIYAKFKDSGPYAAKLLAKVENALKEFRAAHKSKPNK